MKLVAVIALLLAGSPSWGQISRTLKTFEHSKYHMVMDDMVLDVRPGDSKLAGISSLAHPKRWVSGGVAIAFHSSISDYRRREFFKACRQWSLKARIKCHERTHESNFIYVTTNNDGCWAQVGAGDGQRNLNLASGCWSQGTIMHELGHAFGFHHEHQRPDRDRYINIHWDNIEDHRKHNFNVIHGHVIGDYDFASVMHYPDWAFSKNGKDTISVRPEFEGARIGLRALSEGDGNGMAELYGLPDYEWQGGCLINVYGYANEFVMTIPFEMTGIVDDIGIWELVIDCPRVAREILGDFCVDEPGQMSAQVWSMYSRPWEGTEEAWYNAQITYKDVTRTCY